MRRYERILELVDVYAKKKLKISTLRFAEGYASFCKTGTFRFGGGPYCRLSCPREAADMTGPKKAAPEVRKTSGAAGIYGNYFLSFGLPLQ